MPGGEQIGSEVRWVQRGSTEKARRARRAVAEFICYTCYHSAMSTLKDAKNI